MTGYITTRFERRGEMSTTSPASDAADAGACELSGEASAMRVFSV
jgi:hypothetical protein